LTVLGEYILHIDAGIDELLFRNALIATHVPHPGRMAPTTAMAFLSLGIALCFADAHFLRATLLSQISATLGALLGLLAIIGYLYDVGSLYHLFASASMAPHSSMLFLVLGIGIVFARPERGVMATVTSDYVGGQMARRILPVAIVVPTVVGGLRLVGERVGLYDTPFGTALFTTSTIFIFSTVAWLSARSLNRADAKARRALKDLREANEGCGHPRNVLVCSCSTFPPLPFSRTSTAGTFGAMPPGGADSRMIGEAFWARRTPISGLRTQQRFSQLATRGC
jgi:hypothetical protein